MPLISKGAHLNATWEWVKGDGRGGEIDDPHALALALGSPERFELEGIVAAHFGDHGGALAAGGGKAPGDHRHRRR